jgi:quinohemoprotein amine dehydrogenase
LSGASAVATATGAAARRRPRDGAGGRGRRLASVARRVDASWTIEEYAATYEDDDKEYVGTIDAKTGVFTPNIDGPNPKRKHSANNYGDVWVVASYQPTAAEGAARPLKARAHLLVTVPLYLKWDQPEVSR